ncbi:hypothetical protein PoHVEF18_008537 [Penicillium ochrochloron]
MAVVESAARAFLLWLWVAVLRFIILPPEPDTLSPPPLRTPFSFLDLPESVRERIYLLLEYSRKDDLGEKRVVMVNSPDGPPSKPEGICEWSSIHRRFNAAPEESIQHGQGRFANQLFYVPAPYPRVRGPFSTHTTNFGFMAWAAKEYHTFLR